jgi:hypothetical protein
MPVPANSNALSLGRPVIDVSIIDTMDDVRDAFANVYTLLIGAGWPCAAKSGDTAYQQVYYRDNKLWGGKPSDPLNPDELVISGAASGYDTIQEDGVGLTQRTILNFGDGLTASDDAGNTRTNVVLSLTAGTYIDVSGSTINVDLTEVSGYNGASNQILKNSTGTIEWGAGSGGGNAFETIAVPGEDDIVADASDDTLTIESANSFLVITTNAGTDTLTLSVVVTAGDGITISGTTINASGEIAIVTSEIDARTDTTGPDYTMGSGQVTLLVRDSPGVYTTSGGSTGVTVYNSTQMAVPVDRIVQCKWIKGDLFVDVDDCDP